MLNIREYRKNPDRLSDLLPWAALVAPGIILNKDGSFQRTVRYRGPDLDSATESELMATVAHANNAFKRMGANWAIFSESQRVVADRYPDANFQVPLAALIDAERRTFFVDQCHFENFCYLTLVYLLLSEHAGSLAAGFLENSSHKGVDYREALTDFRVETDRIVDLFRGVFPEVSFLDDDQTLTYLHSTISPKRHLVRRPEVPMYLDALLPDTPLIGGLEPRLGNTRFSVVSVAGFPGKCTPGLLDGLNRLAIAYRWTTRFIPMDKNEALSELRKYRRRWFSKRKGIVTLLRETVTGTESALVDSDATNKAADADAALQETADDLVSYGYFTAAVIVADENPKALELKTRAVEKTINSLGLVTITESINAVEAWLGSLPGHCRANVRRPILNTLNLAHLMPISAVWAGPDKNHHFDAPVILHAVTSGSTPYRLSLHVNDVGHTMIIGPTGSGKDVLMATLQAQFLRYRDAQIYIFDKGGSSRALTAGVGGDFYDLGADSDGLSFQPLAGIDNEMERSWATEWILEILRQENLTITPVVKANVWSALTNLASAPIEQRTISGFIALSQNSTIRQAMTFISIDGPLGRIFDATSDTLNYSHWQVFEMENLMNLPSAIAPALSYLFHRLEQRFTGVPTMLFLNEAWVFLDNPVFSPKIREWLKVCRKLNVSVIFATQGLADVVDSHIASALIESCPTRIFLPNDRALQEETSQIYYRFGLNERQVRILALAQPKRQYYYQSSLGNRLFELGLGPLALAYCAVSRKEEQKEVQRILATHGREGFNAEWLRQKDLTWAAKMLESSTNS
jgi:type IV secretion system protein TrbE